MVQQYPINVSSFRGNHGQSRVFCTRYKTKRNRTLACFFLSSNVELSQKWAQMFPLPVHRKWFLGGQKNNSELNEIKVSSCLLQSACDVCSSCSVVVGGGSHVAYHYRVQLFLPSYLPRRLEFSSTPQLQIFCTLGRLVFNKITKPTITDVNGFVFGEKLTYVPTN